MNSKKAIYELENRGDDSEAREQAEVERGEREYEERMMDNEDDDLTEDENED